MLQAVVEEERDTQAMEVITRDMAREGLRGGREDMPRMWGVMGRRGILDTTQRLSLRRTIGQGQGDGHREEGVGRVIVVMIGRRDQKGWFIGIDWVKEDRHVGGDKATGGARI